MKPINKLLTAFSAIVLLVTIERFSFTTKILLQPYNFIRLHEIIQTLILVLLSTVIYFLVLKENSKNFELMKTRKGLILAIIFLIGVYFYAAGEGIHEMAGFVFNTFCPVKTFTSVLCHALFLNDYYSGNIVYFLGGIM